MHLGITRARWFLTVENFDLKFSLNFCTDSGCEETGELTLFIAAKIVFFFAFVAKTVLITC